MALIKNGVCIVRKTNEITTIGIDDDMDIKKRSFVFIFYVRVICPYLTSKRNNMDGCKMYAKLFLTF